MLGRQSIYALDGGLPQADESDSLQADVMRFMAILGLCLMVIFALVQSLPNVPTDRESQRKQAIEQAALMREITELRRQVSAMAVASESEQMPTAQLQTIITDQKQAIEGLQSALSQREKLNSNLTEQLSVLISEQNARMQEQAEQLELEKLETERLAAQKLREEEILEAAAQSRIAELQAAAQADNTKPESESQKPAAASDTQAAQTPIVSETSNSKPDVQKGFRLRFASDASFFQQVASGSIDVFVQSTDGGYKLSADGRKLNSVALPRKVQKINSGSLPASLATLLRKSDIEKSSQWMVVLSGSVRAAIDKARANAEGGLLIIEEDGSVRLE